MKTKSIFIILCLFFGIALTQVNGQKNEPNKTVQGWFESTYWSPVYCGDELVDVLSGGAIRVHYVVHYKDGAFQWETDQLKGEVTSSTGETFRIREVDKYYFADNWFVTWHYNLIGDRGTHYIGTLTYNYLTGETIVGKTVCH